MHRLAAHDCLARKQIPFDSVIEAQCWDLRLCFSCAWKRSRGGRQLFFLNMWIFVCPGSTILWVNSCDLRMGYCTSTEQLSFGAGENGLHQSDASGFLWQIKDTWSPDKSCWLVLCLQYALLCIWAGLQINPAFVYLCPFTSPSMAFCAS